MQRASRAELFRSFRCFGASPSRTSEHTRAATNATLSARKGYRYKAAASRKPLAPTGTVAGVWLRSSRCIFACEAPHVRNASARGRTKRDLGHFAGSTAHPIIVIQVVDAIVRVYVSNNSVKFASRRLNFVAIPPDSVWLCI